MSQIQKRFIADNAVGASQILLENDSTLRARNSTDTADIDILKVTSSNTIEFSSVPQVTSDPVSGNDLVRKSYVDANLKGLKPKEAVAVATTANISLAVGGLLTIDNYTVSAGDRVLVKNQILASQNGIYIASVGSWNRADDFDSLTPIDEINGAYTNIQKGDQAGQSWVVADKVTTLGISPVNFVYFNGADHVVWGSISGNLSDQTDLQNALNAKENLTNKTTDGTLSAESDTLYPTEKAVKTYVDNAILNQDAITKEPTGFATTTTSTMSFDDGTRIFTIAPAAGSFDVYVKGKKFTKTTAQIVTIPNLPGTHYIYFDDLGALNSTQAFSVSLIQENAMVSNIYWNTDTSTHTYFAEERHGVVMDGMTHSYLHSVFGARYISGLALQNFTINAGANNADAIFTSDSGTIKDEDITLQLLAQTEMPVLYRQGQYWRKKSADAFPIIYSGTAGYTGAHGYLPYNRYNGGGWSLTELANNQFVLLHVFATNDIENPTIAIQGTAAYNTIPEARQAANTEIVNMTGLPFAEFVPVGSVIYQTGTYTNIPKARVRQTDLGANYVDFRGTQLYVPSGQASSHGLLSGLSNDDHLQYHTDARGDIRYYLKSEIDSFLALKENLSNKSTDGTFAANSDTLYPTQKATKTFIASSIANAAGDGLSHSGGVLSVDSYEELLTLTGTDITNQYKDLAYTAIDASIHVVPVGGPTQRIGIDYTLSVVGGKTRISFSGDLATGGYAALVSGDVLIVKYIIK